MHKMQMLSQKRDCWMLEHLLPPDPNMEGASNLLGLGPAPTRERNARTFSTRWKEKQSALMENCWTRFLEQPSRRAGGPRRAGAGPSVHEKDLALIGMTGPPWPAGVAGQKVSRAGPHGG